MTPLASTAPLPKRAKSPFARMTLSRHTERLLVDPRRQDELLASLSAEALRRREFDAAFMFADRRCRRPTPRARDFLLRSSASLRLGDEESAIQDLTRAFEIDPIDELVVSDILRRGPPALRRIAAANFIGGVSEHRETLVLALRALKSARVPIASRLNVSRGMVRGWVAWSEYCVLELRIRRGVIHSSFVLDGDPAHPLSAENWLAVEVAIELGSSRPVRISFSLDGKSVLTLSSFAEEADDNAGTRSIASSREPANQVDIIVPVYGNYNATKACLDSLELEGSKITKRMIVIDDCSPDEDLRALLEERASQGRFTLLKNEENLGFARSVNLALQQRQDGDVLLLNADTIVPRGAIDRLAAATHLEADLGTVTPLSNNGEFTSFPRPNTANALDTIEEIQALDDVAQIVNDRDIVDLPTGIGFCLYISRACADAVGPLPDLYSRGYYEDVEFCLKAQELGFRSVCATNVFVGHAGASSFLDEKRTLVVRNLSILEARFPEHRLQCGAFLQADPLASARARIEEHIIPKGLVALLVAPVSSAHALVLERARQIQSEVDGLHCILCEFAERASCVIIRSLRGSVPQSLRFAVSDRAGQASLESYLKRLLLKAVEVFDPQSLPEAMLEILFKLETPFRFALGDLRWICGSKLVVETVCSKPEDRGGRGCVGPRRMTQAAQTGVDTSNGSRLRQVLRRAQAIVPLDRMAAAFSASYLKPIVASPCVPRPPRGSITSLAKLQQANLGVICPEANGDVDRQIITLGRMFRLHDVDASIIVLGQCVNELAVMASGNVFVTGAIGYPDYPNVIRRYGITKLLSAYRTSHFRIVDDLGAICGLQKAFFDWSFGALEIDDGDLALDPRTCVCRAALKIGAWLVDEFAFCLSP